MTGLVGWWPLNEDSGTTAYDLSGNGNHGSLNGGIVQGVAGKGGLTSYSFDGSDDYISLSPSYSSDVGSMFIWVYPQNSISSLKYVVYSPQGTDDRGGIGVDSNGNFGVRAGDKGVASTATSKAPASPNEWSLIGYMWNNGSYEIFYNGKSISTGTYNGDVDLSTSGFRIGAQNDNTNNFDGVLSNLRLYNRALSPQEVKELYNWSHSVFARPLNDQNSSSTVSRWAFDGDATDEWGNNDGGTTGGVSYSSNSIRGQSVDLDGTDDYVEISDDSSLDYNNQVTISAWLYPRGFSEVGPIWDDWKWGSNVNALLFRVETDGKVGFWVSPDASSSDNIFSNRSLKSNNWQHLVATFNSGEARIYYNGSLDNSKNLSVSSIYNRAYDKSIGEYGAGGNLNALMDDFRIYDKALSSSEVFELYRWGTRGRDMRKLTVNSRGL